MDVSIAALSCDEQAAITWIGGLSLGLIPSWATCNTFQVSISAYEQGATIASGTHYIRQRTVVHLLFIPVLWVNFLLPSGKDRIAQSITPTLTAVRAD